MSFAAGVLYLVLMKMEDGPTRLLERMSFYYGSLFYGLLPFITGLANPFVIFHPPKIWLSSLASLHITFNHRSLRHRLYPKDTSIPLYSQFPSTLPSPIEPRSCR